jgi:toxin ParE1/3/4
LKRIVFDPAVKLDIRTAKRYYEKKRPGLGEDFRRRVFDQFERIALYPLAAPVVEDDVRRIGMEKFPFEIYYRADEKEIFVIEVRHRRRQPDSWKKRL